jgi:hypothetical protein
VVRLRDRRRPEGPPLRAARRLSCVALVVSLVTVGCSGDGEDPEAAEVPAGWQVHEFDGGSVATPEGWQVGEPLLDDALTVRGPEPEEGLAPILRVKLGDDQVPFDNLMQLFAASLTLQVADLEPLGSEPRDVTGAEAAEVAEFRYIERVDGAEVPIREKVVVARSEDGGDLQLRLGAPEADFDGFEDLAERIVDTVRLGT